jgi:hypothetical protein
MANPAWITQENVKFNSVLDNAAVLDTTDDVRSLILWDDLSLDDQKILTDFIDNNGAALPLAGPTSGSQIIDFLATKAGADATGLSNVAAATAGVATINIGGDKIAADASGLSSAQGTKGQQVANFDTTIAAGTVTNLVPTAGYQSATFTVPKVGGDASGLAVDAGGYQVVNVGGAITGASATGLTDDVPAAAGYQVVNVGGAKTGASATGLTNDATVYTATITVDGVAKPIAVTGSTAQDYTTLLAEINTDLGASAVASIVGGNIQITSATTGVASSVSAVDVDLFATLTDFVAIVAAVAGTDAVITTYTASIDIDGGAHTRAISITGGAAQTYTELAAELDSDSGGWYTAAVVGGNLRITSLQPGLTSDIVITDTDLFSSLTDYVAILAGVAGTHPVYTATITVDGVAKPISIDGNNAQTFTTLVDELNTDLGVSATAAVINGGITVTSATVGNASSVAIVDVDLFAGLTNFSAITAAVAGLHTTAALTATIVVDGVTKNISILPSAIPTFGDVINEINTDLGASATASISGGDIKVQSATFGITSTVAITAGTLFPALPGFLYLLPAQNGDDTSRTYSATVVIDGTVVKSIKFTGVEGDTIQHVLDEINTDLGASATAAVTAIPGNIKITSATTGVHSTVDIYDNGFLFNQLTGYAGISTVPGVAPTLYTANVTVDGTAVRPISIQGSAAQTFSDLVTELTTDLQSGGAVASAALTTPVAGYQDVNFSAVLVGGSATGLAVNIPNYTANIVVDGFDVEVMVDGNVAQTITDLLTAINTDLGVNATATINADGGLRITSAATGIASSIVIEDDATVPLFSALTSYVGIAPDQVGIGSNIIVTSASTGVNSKIAIVDGTLFNALGAKGIRVGINGIANMLTAAGLQKISGSEPVADHFNVIRVGLTPSSLWSHDHVPVKANIPKIPQNTYWATTWKYLADDTEVNP